MPVTPASPGADSNATTWNTLPRHALSLRPAIWTIVWHALLIIALVTIYLSVTSRFEKIFEDFDLDLPVMTRIAVSVSLYPTVLILACCGAVLADAGICLLMQRQGGPTLRRRWSVVFLIALILLAGITVCAVLLGAMQLITELS